MFGTGRFKSSVASALLVLAALSQSAYAQQCASPGGAGFAICIVSGLPDTICGIPDVLGDPADTEIIIPGSPAYDYCTPAATTNPAVTSGNRIVTDLENQAVNNLPIFGMPAGGQTAVGATGRVQKSRHDGFRETTGTASTTSSSETSEGSAFLSVRQDLPGTVMGYRISLSGVVGGTTLANDQPGRGGPRVTSENDSLLIGGSYTLSQGSFYAASTLVYFDGETESDVIANNASFTSDTDGYVYNSVLGYVFNVPGVPDLRFDLRGGLGRVHGEDSFESTTNAAVVNYTRRDSEVEYWQGSLAGMLFILLETDAGVSRPYIQATYRRMFDYSNTAIIGVGGVTFAQAYDQGLDYGRLEMGFDHVSGNTTFGAAVYGETSEDERVVGGRAGLSFKF